MSVRRWWVSDKEPLPVAKQCALASVNRSTVYLPSIVLFPDAEELRLLELIDQEYTRHPFYGTRKIMHYLRNEGYKLEFPENYNDAGSRMGISRAVRI